MPRFATTLGAEMRRLARREIRDRVHRQLRKAQRRLEAAIVRIAEQRRELGRLRRRVERLAQLRPTGGARKRAGAMPPATIRALRARLQMTRARFARAVGASPSSIFLWEHGRAVPRSATVARLQALGARGRRRRPRRKRKA